MGSRQLAKKQTVNLPSNYFQSFYLNICSEINAPSSLPHPFHLSMSDYEHTLYPS
jgi:hypothetical protein